MANVSIRMDDNLKKQAEDLFNDLGYESDKLHSQFFAKTGNQRTGNTV